MRTTLSHLTAIPAILLVGLTSACLRPGDTPVCQRCNVVLVSIDTLRSDHVGAYGYGRATTPNFDRLASRSVLFENAISQSSWTRPAHMSILTGLHPHEHGFVSLADRRRLDDHIPTLATVLKERGYATAAFVGGVNLTASVGFDRGFDVFRSNGRTFRDNLEDVRWWLDHRDEQAPFFLFVHGYDAHTPYANDPVDRLALGLTAPAPSFSHSETCRSSGDTARIAPFVDEYDASIHRADRYLGKILDDLERRALPARTIVIVLSDHGEEFLEHGGCFHLSTLYREVLEVPLLVAAPGLRARREPALVPASVGIAPTIAHLLGLEGHPFPGASLLEAPDGPASQQIVSETERQRGHRGEGRVLAVTTPAEKLIHWTTASRFEWFDRAADSAEQRPVGESARQHELARLLDDWIARHPPRAATRRLAAPDASPAPEAAPGAGGLDEHDEDDLRSLGYVE